VIAKVFHASGGAGGVFFLEPFVTFEVEHKKAESNERGPLQRGEGHRESIDDSGNHPVDGFTEGEGDTENAPEGDECAKIHGRVFLKGGAYRFQKFSRLS